MDRLDDHLEFRLHTVLPFNLFPVPIEVVGPDFLWRKACRLTGKECAE